MTDQSELLNFTLTISQLKQDQLELKNQLAQILASCDRIEKLCSKSEQASERINNHINFVEGVYSVVRSPFSRMLKLISGEVKALPDSQTI